MPLKRPKLFPLILSALSYLLFYSFFTGAVQLSVYESYYFNSFSILPVYYSSETYTGPGLQITYGSYFLEVRVVPFVVGMLIAVLLGVNVAYLWSLYRMGGLKTCLRDGAGGGFAAFIASIATYSYICCGWAPSMLLVGGSAVASFAAGFTVIPAAVAAVILLFNAYILSKRIKTLEIQSKAITGMGR